MIELTTQAVVLGRNLNPNGSPSTDIRERVEIVKSYVDAYPDTVESVFLSGGRSFFLDNGREVERCRDRKQDGRGLTHPQTPRLV